MADLRVVVAVLTCGPDVLLSRRAEHGLYAGLLEFPGGKVEPGESNLVALQRELREELGIQVSERLPLLWEEQFQVRESLRLHLSFYEVAYASLPAADQARIQESVVTGVGAEGQELKWCRICDLNPTQFPGANADFIRWLIQR